MNTPKMSKENRKLNRQSKLARLQSTVTSLRHVLDFSIDIDTYEAIANEKSFSKEEEGKTFRSFI